jgi:hypothetical protein
MACPWSAQKEANADTYREFSSLREARSILKSNRDEHWLKLSGWYLKDSPRAMTSPVDLSLLPPIILQILKRYEIDPSMGFISSDDPLRRIPVARYHIWEDMADDLPKLLGARLGQARGPLRSLPVLDIDLLTTVPMLKRAHLLLCLFAHAYVWGGQKPLNEIPEGIARPLWDVSNKLGIPPVLGMPSIILANYRRLDPNGDICMENLSTLNNFFDGRDESWFYLITVEVEKRGGRAVLPMLLAIAKIRAVVGQFIREGSLTFDGQEGFEGLGLLLPKVFGDASSGTGSIGENEESTAAKGQNAKDNCDEIFENKCKIDSLSPETFQLAEVVHYVTQQLREALVGIEGMCNSMETMHEGCHPFIFYHRVRPFLSAWKENPTLPDGVLYKGVSEEPKKYYGGSAAQSSLIPFLDISLGISHAHTESNGFLRAMREYMLPTHRDFLSYLESVACLRAFVVLMSTLSSADIFVENTETELHGEWLAIRDFIASNPELCGSVNDLEVARLAAIYDACVEGLQRFRSIHINLVSLYIIAQQKTAMKAASGSKDPETLTECPHAKNMRSSAHEDSVVDQPILERKPTLDQNAGGKGTGGTELMKFLKPIRNNCRKSLLISGGLQRANTSSDGIEALNVCPPTYTKDNGKPEDIDLYADQIARAGEKPISKATW